MRHTFKRWAGALATLGLTFLAGCGQPGPTSGHEPVRIALNWFPEPEHGGFYAALVHGYYREAGLDVEIEENRWPYRGFRIGTASVGVDTMILPEVAMAHTFVVRVPRPRDEVGEDLLLRLHRVIEAEKPASTNYFLQFTDVEGVTEVVGMRIGVSSAVGVEVEGEAEPGTGTADS